MYKPVLIFYLLFAVSINANQNEEQKPKLVVAIVVDQMRYDFLENLSHRFSENGFNRLINEGYNCKNNFFNYVPTVTGPGHSSISTGSTPMTHGIVGNNWYDREQINPFIVLMMLDMIILEVMIILVINLQIIY